MLIITIFGWATALIGSVIVLGYLVLFAIDFWWRLWRFFKKDVREIRRNAKKECELWREFQRWKIKQNI